MKSRGFFEAGPINFFVVGCGSGLLSAISRGRLETVSDFGASSDCSPVSSPWKKPNTVIHIQA